MKVMVYKYWKIECLKMKSGIMMRMAYPLDFFLIILAVLSGLALPIFFVGIIFSFINNLSGWNFYEALLVVVSFSIVDGLLWATTSFLIGFNLIKRGKLDIVLVKPMDAQFLLSIWSADPEDWAKVFTGIVLLSISITHIFSNFDLNFFVNLFFYVILIFNAFIIMYSFVLFVKTFSFWIIEDSALWAITNNLQMSEYPTDIFFHKAAKILFSAVIPLAFIATVPAKVLIHGPKLDLIFYSCLLAAVFFIGSRKFFLYGLKHYSSASS